MPTVIDSLIVELGLKTTQFNDDANKAKETVSKTRKSVEGDAKKLEHSFYGVNESVNQLHRTLLGLFAAFTGGKTIKALVGDLTDAGAATGRLATNLGMSSDKVDAFGRAVEQMGGSSGDAKESLQRLTDQYQTFLSTGNLGDLPRIIGQLNQFGKTSVDVTKPLTDQLDAISDGLANIAKTDPAKASFIARQIFGNTGMANLALQGSKKMREMLAEAQQSALTPKQAAIMEKLQQQVVRLQQAFTSVGNAIVEAIGPKLTEFLKKSADWVKENIGDVSKWAVAIGVAAGAFTALKLAFAALSFIFSMSPLGRVITLVSLLAGGVVYLMQKWNESGLSFEKFVETGKKKFRDFIDVIKNSAPHILSAFKSGFGVAFDWLASKLQWLWENVPGHQIINWLWDKAGGAAAALNREFGVGSANAREYEGNPSPSDRVGPGHGRRRVMRRGGGDTGENPAAPTPGGGSGGGSTTNPGTGGSDGSQPHPNVPTPPRRPDTAPTVPTPPSRPDIDAQIDKVFPRKGKGGNRLERAKANAIPYSAEEAKREMGLSGAEWDAYRNGVASIESAGNYGLMGGSNNHFAGRYQMGMIGHREVAETAARLGVPVPSKAEFLANKQMQERFFENYTMNHHRYLMDKSNKYRNLSKEQKLMMLGYAHNQGEGNAVKYLNGGRVGRDAFGTAGTAYFDPIKSGLDALNGSSPKRTAFSGMGASALSSNIQDMRQTNSYNSNAQAHINQVNIHVPSGDPQTIGTGLGNALQRQLAAGQANYGAR